MEIFHEFGKHVTGFESAQVRNEESVKRHFRLSCVAQSLLQDVAAPASKTEKFEFAKGQITFGQRLRAVTREILAALLRRAQQLFKQGQSCEQVLEALMPV